MVYCLLYFSRKIYNMKNSNHTLSDSFINGLKEATTELEDLQVQMALGKAELEDKYHEVKHKAKTMIEKAKNEFYLERSEATGIKAKLEHLRVQFALAKAETRDAIREQKKNILHAIHDVENLIKNH